MPSYRGIVKGNVVVLPEDAELADGQVVEVYVPPSESEQSIEWSPEQRLKRRLIELGLVREAAVVPPGPAGDDWTPIEVTGKPLSEHVLEDSEVGACLWSRPTTSNSTPLPLKGCWSRTRTTILRRR